MAGWGENETKVLRHIATYSLNGRWKASLGQVVSAICRGMARFSHRDKATCLLFPRNYREIDNESLSEAAKRY